MITTAAVWAWQLMAATLGWLDRKADRLQADEAGSPTLETVGIAAGLMALAARLPVAIKVAAGRYAGQRRWAPPARRTPPRRPTARGRSTAAAAPRASPPPPA